MDFVLCEIATDRSLGPQERQRDNVIGIHSKTRFLLRIHYRFNSIQKTAIVVRF